MSWFSELITCVELSSSGHGKILSSEVSVIRFLILNCNLLLVVQGSLIAQIVVCHTDVQPLWRIE